MRNLTLAIDDGLLLEARKLALDQNTTSIGWCVTSWPSWYKEGMAESRLGLASGGR